MDEKTDPTGCAARRHAAGEDPAKRRQILDGAHAVFSRLGFDAASMSDITREARVSKGTIYVYFDGKEDLFTALMEDERARLFADLESAIEGPEDVAEKLRRFGTLLARLLCSDEVVRAQRVVLGICERMPDIGARFYEGGSRRGVARLAAFLEHETAQGALCVEDGILAAYQFVELSSAGLLRRRLFGHMKTPPADADVARTVDAAVDMFLARYGGASRG